MLRNYDGKCLFMGDFNLVLSREEKERGVWNATCQNRVWNKWMRLHSLDLNVIGDILLGLFYNKKILVFGKD